MKEIIQLYEEGNSCKSISKIVGINYHKVSRFLKDNGIEIRGHNIKEKYKSNEDFFSNMTHFSSYWLGFLYADGNISTYADSFNLAISIKDIEHLKLFKECISSDSKIKIYKRKNQPNSQDLCKLVISSKNLVDDLINIGCIRNKTFLLKEPKIDKKFYPDFIRGYFDGDGCITCNERKYNTKKGVKICKSLSCYIRFTGTIEILRFIIKNLPLKNKNLKLYHPKKAGDKNFYQLNIGGSKNVKLIREYLYYTKNLVFLERKFEKFPQKDVQRL